MVRGILILNKSYSMASENAGVSAALSFSHSSRGSSILMHGCL